MQMHGGQRRASHSPGRRAPKMPARCVAPGNQGKLSQRLPPLCRATNQAKCGCSKSLQDQTLEKSSPTGLEPRTCEVRTGKERPAKQQVTSKPTLRTLCGSRQGSGNVQQAKTSSTPAGKRGVSKPGAESNAERTTSTAAKHQGQTQTRTWSP
jgi:hypothetical protein